MQRTKVLAVLMAAASAAAAAVVLSGSASAGEWHSYEGTIHPGHAYGLAVPDGAESYEVVFSGTGAARLALLDPEGAPLGYHVLTPSLATAAVAQPAAGRHVLYVYEVADGALSVRVNAEAAPSLALQKLPLVTEETEVATGDGGALDKAMKVSLKGQPVFLTLLYEGSVSNLDATIASAKGDVVTIKAETGTAFAPGAWSALRGERTTSFDNLDGSAYTIKAKADRFEGAMRLTTVAVDFGGKPILPMPIVGRTSPAEPVDAPAASPAAPQAEFSLPVGTAVAFTAKAGTLTLFDPEAVEEARDPESSHYGDWASMAVSVYAPDDTLLAYVVADDENLQETVELPVDGEYVVFVHAASADALVGSVASLSAVRELPLVEETFEFYATGLPGVGSEFDFDLAHAPVAMHLEAEDFSLLSNAYVENENGPVAERGETIGFGPESPFGAWTNVYPENFAAGEHRFSDYGLVAGAVRVVSVAYLREAPAETPEPAAEDGAAAPLLDLFG